MTSTQVQFIMIGFYVILMTMTFFEKNWGKSIYWLGAIILSIGVLIMK